MSAATIAISKSQLGEIEAAARAAYPAECCGLIVGRRAADGGGEAALRITRVVGARNIAAGAAGAADDRFEVAPQARFALMRELGNGPERIIGHYHSHPGHAAKPSPRDLDAAFDPATNVGYAANFLAGLRRETGDWQSAVAHYHSSNAALNRDYQKKVVSLWNKVRRRAAGSAERIAYQPPLRGYVGERRGLTLRLDTRFRARLRAERRTRKGEGHRQQLDKWRQARLDPSIMSQVAVRRQADRERLRRARLKINPVDFATKRRNQLAAWRKQRHWKPVAR